MLARRGAGTQCRVAAGRPLSVWRWATQGGGVGWAWLGALVLMLLGWGVPVRAQPLQPVPALTARVMDLTGTLSAEQRAALEARLAAFERERGSQVVVLMVPTTAPEDITDYTQRVGDAWKIGRRDVGDGVLLVVAKDDRRLRIATTKAVEGAIPDLLASRIIERAIVPRFRDGDYFGGLQAGVEQILAALAGEPLPLPGADAAAPARQAAGAGGKSGTDDGPDIEGAVVFAFFAVPLIAAVLRGVLGRVLGAVGTAGWAAFMGVVLGLPVLWVVLLAVAAFVLALTGVSMGRGVRGGGRWPGASGGAMGGGWSGGGGFSSGGGGNFGGGGASGRW